MDEQTVEIARRGAAAWVWMDRQAASNALNGAMIAALTRAFETLGRDESARMIVLAGRGKHFCAGADIEAMKRQGAAAFDENLEDARALAALFHAIAACPKPTIARVQGAAIGGGFGLVACCDMAIAAAGAVFATSEVRLGLIPATIGPYVVRAVGRRRAAALFLSAERVAAPQAMETGLVQSVVPAEHLDLRVEEVCAMLAKGGPQAQAAAKQLIDAVAGRAVTPELMEETALRIAQMRAGDEAREGLSAFLEKRQPAWARPADEHV